MICTLGLIIINNFDVQLLKVSMKQWISLNKKYAQNVALMFLHVRRRKCTENTSAFNTFHVVSPVPSSVTKDSEYIFKFKVNLEHDILSICNDEIIESFGEMYKTT